MLTLLRTLILFLGLLAQILPLPGVTPAQAANCVSSVTPSSVQAGMHGGSYTLQVNVPAPFTCAYTVLTADDWIAVQECPT